LETVVLDANIPGNIELCGEILRGGGVVAFPTETVYGLGANALSESSVAGIFSVKGRPADNPLIVHVASLDDAVPLVVSISDTFRLLADKFWPGPLTLIARKSGIVPDNVTAGLDTVAIRMPSHSAALALIRAFGGPVAAPSANPSGRPSPTKASHVFSDIGGKLPFILDGGDCTVGIESTVLDISGSAARILRPGCVTLDELRAVLGVVGTQGELGVENIVPSANSPCIPEYTPKSPGMKYRHYAPRAPLTAVIGSAEATADYIIERLRYGVEGACENIAALMFDDYALSHPNVVTFGNSGDYAAQASRLFDALRAVDAMGLSAIFVQAPPEDGMGLAVANRIKKAAGSNIVDLNESL